MNAGVGEVGVTVFYGEHAQVGSAQTVKLTVVDVSSEFSEVYCPESVVAGDPIACTILTRDSNNEDIGDSSLAGSFHFEAQVRGQVIDVTDIFALKKGVFQGRFVPTIAGGAKLSIEIRLGDTHVPIGDVSVSVNAGGIVSSFSYVLCDAPDTVGIGLKCYVHGSDSFGNPTGSAVDLDAFKAVASAEGSTEETALSIAFMDGLFEINFTPLSSALYTLQVWYGESAITQWKDGTSYVPIGYIQAPPGAIVAETSSFECPVSAPGLAFVYCTIQVFDIYGNSAVADADLATRFYVGVSGAATPTVASVAPLVGTFGTYFIRFKAPSTGNMSVQVTYDGDVLLSPNPQTVTVAAVDVSAEYSEVFCPDSVVAGDAVVCQIFTRDSNQEFIGDGSLAGSFLTDVHLKGYELDVDQITPLTTGRYQARITPTSTGSMSFCVRFRTADGIAILGEEASVEVTAGRVDSTTSAVECDAAGVAGQAVSCRFYFADVFGNAAGTEDAVAAIAADIVDESGNRIAMDSTAWVDGHATVAFVSTISRLWSVSATLFGSPITGMDGALPVIKIVDSGVVADRSTFVCPDKAIVGSVLTCTVVCNDEFGNLATTAPDDAVNRFFISAANEETPPPFVQIYGILHGVVSFSITPSVAGNVVLSGTYASQELGNFATVSVEFSAISAAGSDLNCPEDTEAGLPTGCFVTTRDASGSTTGDASSTTAFTIDIRNQGQLIDAQPVFIDTGLYKINFVPTRTGEVHASVSLGSDIVGGTSLAVFPGDVDASKTVVKCRSAQYRAGDEIVCDVSSVDIFGNPAGGADVAEAFTVELMDQSGRSVATSGVFPASSLGSFSTSGLSHTAAEVCAIGVSYNGLQGADMPVVDVTYGSVALEKTAFECPSVGTVGGAVVCEIRTFDAFDNHVPPSIASSSLFLFNVILGTLSPAVEFSTDIAGGRYIVSYSAAATGDAELSALVGQVQFGPFATTIETTLIDASTSFIACPETSADEPLEAGDTIVCFVTARNSADESEGGVESVGSLVATSKVKGATSTGTIEFVDVGLYKAIFTLATSGTVEVSMGVQGSDSTELVGDSAVEVVVTAASMDCKQSYVSCPASIVAGVDFVCRLWSLDVYGNPTGGEDVLEAISASIETPSSVTAGSLAWTREGLYEATLATTVSGDNNLVSVAAQGCHLGETSMETLPSAVSPSDSFYSCQSTIVAGAPVDCEVSAFDEYGNAAGTNSDVSNVNVLVQIGDTLVPSAVSFVEVGLFQVQFVPEKLGSLSIAVLYDGTALDFVYQARRRLAGGALNDTIIARGGQRRLNSGSIDVEQGDICAATSTAVCSSSVIAGQTITCMVYTKDCDGEAAGSEYEAASIDGRLVVQGLDASMDVDFGGVGVFQASLTATTADEGIYAFAVRTVTEDERREKRQLLGIELDELSEVSPSSVSVSSAAISAEHTEVDCDVSAIAGGEVECTVRPYDAFGNPTGVEDDAVAFSVSVSTSTGVTADAAVMFVSAGELRTTFSVEEAGAASVTVQYLGNDVGNSAGGGMPVGVLIQAGDATNANSSFACPVSVTAFSDAPCSVFAHDVYGNPTNAGLSSDVFDVKVVMGSETLTDFEISLSETTVEGELVVKFVITQVGQAEVSIRLFGEALVVSNSENTISVEEGTVSSDTTLLVCPEDAVAGSFVLCSIFGKDVDGDAAGTAAEVSAFQLTIVDGDGTSVWGEVVHFSEGLYKMQFQLERSGNASVTVQYLGSTLGGNETETIVVVGPAAISAALSELHCPSEGMVASEVTCELNAKDEFGNPSGMADEASAFTAGVSVGGSSPMEATVVFRDGGSVGEFDARFQVTQSGTAVVVVSANNEALPEDGNVDITPDVMNAGTSSLECPTAVVISSASTCALAPFDRFGNPAVNLTGFETFITNEGFTIETDVLQQEDGDFEVAFTPLHVGDLLLAAHVEGTPLSGTFPLNITVEYGDISSVYSSYSCTDSSMVGDFLDCFIYARNSSDHEIGSAADAAGFQVGFVESVVAAHSPSVVFISGGIFQAKLSTYKSGSYVIDVQYAGQTLQSEASAVEFVASDLSVSHSFVECPASAGVVGGSIVCIVHVRDAYGNAKGDAALGDALSSGLTAQGNVHAAASTVFVGVGAYEIEFANLPRAFEGIASVDVKYGAASFLTSGGVVSQVEILAAVLTPNTTGVNQTTHAVHFDVLFVNLQLEDFDHTQLLESTAAMLELNASSVQITSSQEIQVAGVYALAVSVVARTPDFDAAVAVVDSALTESFETVIASSLGISAARVSVSFFEIVHDGAVVSYDPFYGSSYGSFDTSYGSFESGGSFGSGSDSAAVASSFGDDLPYPGSFESGASYILEFELLASASSFLSSDVLLVEQALAKSLEVDAEDIAVSLASLAQSRRKLQQESQVDLKLFVTITSSSQWRASALKVRLEKDTYASILLAALQDEGLDFAADFSFENVRVYIDEAAGVYSGSYEKDGRIGSYYGSDMPPVPPVCIFDCSLFDLVNTGEVDDCAVATFWLRDSCLDDCSAEDMGIVHAVQHAACDDHSDLLGSYGGGGVDYGSHHSNSGGDGGSDGYNTDFGSSGGGSGGATSSADHGSYGGDSDSGNSTDYHSYAGSGGADTGSADFGSYGGNSSGSVDMDTASPTSRPTMSSAVVASFDVELAGANAVRGYGAAAFAAAFADASGLDASRISTRASLLQNLELAGIATVDNTTEALLVATVAAAAGVPSAAVSVLGFSSTSGTGTINRRLEDDSVTLAMAVAVADDNALQSALDAMESPGTVSAITNGLLVEGITVSAVVEVTGLAVEVVAYVDSVEEVSEVSGDAAFVETLGNSLEAEGFTLGGEPSFLPSFRYILPLPSVISFLPSVVAFLPSFRYSLPSFLP
jgi:hypothetical protein